MPKLVKIKIPLIVTADGKWAVVASHREEGDAIDWSGIDEYCDYDNPTLMPKRFLVETVVEVSELQTVIGAAIPEPERGKLAPDEPAQIPSGLSAPLDKSFHRRK